MFIARWQIQARFGHKQKVLDHLPVFAREIAPAAGWAEGKGKVLSGSIGVSEATVEHHWTVETLDELDRVWAKLGALDAHKRWSKELEPHIVSGSSRWDVLRVV
jgi:hypothetical protein